VPREPHRHAPFHGNRIYIGVAVVFGAEGNRLPVGRKTGLRLYPRIGGEPPYICAVDACHPQVVGIDKNDMRRTQIGLVHHPRVGGADGCSS